MFKYVSEILTKFTQKQRIFALMILLISIIIISIGPKITESFTYNDQELNLRVESQNVQIGELTQRVNELNTQVIKNQRECVNEIIRRESEILDMINEIDLHARKTKNETRIIKSEPHLNKYIVSEDTVEVLMSSSQVSSTIVETKKDEKLIKMINKLKNKVSDDIKEK